MPKALGKARIASKLAEKVIHSNKIETTIPAGMAGPGPPLGPMLGQRGVNIAGFCKDFNSRTAMYREGVPLPTRVTVNADRSYEMYVNSPPTSFLLKQAAGITRGAMRAKGEVSGKVTLKHVYEIACIKQKDRACLLTPLDVMVRAVVGTAHSIGLQVVRHLDADEYGEFLKERRKVVEEQLAEIQEKKEAKLLKK